MKHMRRLFFTLILALAGFTAFAQKDSVLIKAARLNRYAIAIDTLTAWSDSANAISNYNEIIINELPALLADKNILKYNIRDLFGDINGIGVTMSDDGKLRIFNWFANTGGSWQMYYEIRQYVDGNKIYVSPVEESVGTGKIYKFATPSGVFYLAESGGRTCNTCFVVAARALVFTDGELQLCKSCIEGADGIVSVDYRWDNLLFFGYDETSQVLSMAFITDDLNMGQDEKNYGKTVFEAYKFNDNFFEELQPLQPAAPTEEK